MDKITASIIEWDGDGSIDIKMLDNVLRAFGVSIVKVPDTGGDSHAVVVGRPTITKEDAQKFYEEYEGLYRYSC